jgi:hypothetical protein
MVNFILVNDHKYSLSELDSMMPFEREIYVTLLEQQILKKQQQAAKSQ